MPQPESDRPPIRFVAADPSHRLRIALGARLLIGAASGVFWFLGKLGSRKTIHRGERVWARLVTWLLRIRLDIDGAENIDHTRSYTVVALHEGFADAVALLCLRLPLRFLVRDELFEWPSLGRYLRASGQIEVVEPSTRSTLREMYRRIALASSSGDSLVVFAQGSILGVEVAFQSGALRIARSLSTPVLPVVITGSHRVWEHPYTPLVRLDQTISLRVMPPLQPDQLDSTTLRDLEQQMKRIALDSSTAPVRHFDPTRDGWWDGYRYDIDPDFPELARRLARRRADSR